MKIAINRCYGGFSLSREAVERMAELNGQDCHAFTHDYKTKKYIPLKRGERGFCPFYFSIPNPNDFDMDKNENWNKYSLNNRFYDEQRADPKLIQVVEELGDKANGECAELAIVEVPDGISWEISEYDGMERVVEKHNSWC